MSIDYHQMPARLQPPIDQPSFHEWDLPRGGIWTSFHRVNGGYLLRFPGLADFLISPGGLSATCWPAPDLSESTREHLFFNQVQPLMLSEQGRLVFHASCVECGDGAIAFLGRSGRGKSTLATMFATQGARFLTDDALVLESAGGRYLAQPSHPSIRLWDDSRDALLQPGFDLAPPVSYTDKGRVHAAARLPHCSDPKPLLAAFFLGEDKSDDISIRPLRGGEALAAWLGQSFLLDIEERATLESHFAGIVPLAESVPANMLDFPRRYDGGYHLCGRIVEHALQLGLAA